MPKNTTKQSVLKATSVLAPDIPRFQLSEVGQTGLRVTNGAIQEEIKKELEWPESVKTYKKMSYDSTIAAALGLYELYLMRSVWKVRVPEGADPDKAEFISQSMHDMEHTWLDFIVEAGSFVTYGFSVNEKVYRKRLRSKGSRYNDGLISWAKLPTRSQDSITKWIYDDEGRNLLAIEQNTSDRNLNYFRSIKQTNIILPRNKFLHFRIGKNKDNPLGQSPLRNVYYTWKLRCAIEEQEAIGIQRDLGGYPVIRMPAVFMSDDATPAQKAAFAGYQNIIRNMHMNEQAGLILPSDVDPETKAKLFELEVLGVQGGKSYDTSEIIKRYDAKILTALFADGLILGQGSTGSFALGEAKNQLMKMAIEARLKEIANVINKDLIPQTFDLNGWTDEVLPEIYFEDARDQIDLETFSKAIQRMKSVNAIEPKRDVFNRIREVLGLDALPEDEEIDPMVLGQMQSRSGDGMATPFEGTRTNPGEGNDNDQNMDNVA